MLLYLSQKEIKRTNNLSHKKSQLNAGFFYAFNSLLTSL
jgi:hypothetical protein